MSEIGRNDPCPCGSGKKYKRCCMERHDVQPSPDGSFTPAERSSAMAKLWCFAASPEFAHDWEIAQSIFWGGRLQDQDPDRVKELMRLPQTEVMYNSWRLFDLEIEDGATLIDLFLASRASGVSAGERAYLERAKTTFTGLYEVEEVRLEEKLRLTDLWRGARLWVREGLATHNVVKWDLVAARLMQVPDGSSVMEAGAFQYPPQCRDLLLKEMKRRYSAFQRRLPKADDVALLKRLAPFLTHLWLDLVIFAPPPKIVTPEGDQFIFAAVVFDVTDEERLHRSLVACAEIEEIEPNVFSWWEAAGSRRRSLGTLKLQGNRLVLQTVSRERAERGRMLFESVATTTVRYRATSYQDVRQAVREFERRPPRQPEETLPSGIAAQVTREFREQHYRAWPDQPLPALGGRTPRPAATLKSPRAALINLL